MRPGRFTKDELRYYVYLGRTPTKKVKTLTFSQGVPGAVWDRKIHALMTRLPYFREATEDEIASVEAGGKAKAKAKAPQPEARDQNDDRDALRAELDRRHIEYDKRWGPKKLMEALQSAPMIQAAEPEAQPATEAA